MESLRVGWTSLADVHRRDVSTCSSTYLVLSSHDTEEPVNASVISHGAGEGIQLSTLLRRLWSLGLLNVSPVKGNALLNNCASICIRHFASDNAATNQRKVQVGDIFPFTQNNLFVPVGAWCSDIRWSTRVHVVTSRWHIANLIVALFVSLSFVDWLVGTVCVRLPEAHNNARSGLVLNLH